VDIGCHRLPAFMQVAALPEMHGATG